MASVVVNFVVVVVGITASTVVVKEELEPTISTQTLTQYGYIARVADCLVWYM